MQRLGGGGRKIRQAKIILHTCINAKDCEKLKHSSGELLKKKAYKRQFFHELKKMIFISSNKFVSYIDWRILRSVFR